MPVATDDRPWIELEPAPSTREGVREFLSEHEGLAYTEREVTDAVLGTDWASVHERERLKEELGEEEFYDRLEAGDYPDLEAEASFGRIMDRRLDTSFIKFHLSALVAEGSVTAKLVPASETSEPTEAGAVPHYAWSG